MVSYMGTSIGTQVKSQWFVERGGLNFARVLWEVAQWKLLSR